MIVEGVRSSSSRRVPDHVVVAMLIADVSYCMDVDGVASQDAFLWEWHIVHGLNQDALVPLDEQQLAMAAIISHPEMSSRIADALHRKFGSWQPALLHAFSRRAAEHQQGR